MRTQLRPAVVVLIALTLITGLLYPLVVTGLAQILFPQQANGSLILINGRPAGSFLIGQPFDEPKYFWGRPSATSPFPYNAAVSSGSNLGPTNDALMKAVQARIDAFKTADPDNPLPLPVDLVTASGSGLDPHISPAGAEFQIRRIARARRLDETVIRRLVAQHTEGRQFGVLGEPRVNVLTLNFALDTHEKESAPRDHSGALGATTPGLS